MPSDVRVKELRVKLDPLPLWAHGLANRDLILLEQGRYTLPALVARLCRSERSVCDLLRTGALQGRKVAGRWIVREDVVERFMDAE